MPRLKTERDLLMLVHLAGLSASEEGELYRLMAESDKYRASIESICRDARYRLRGKLHGRLMSARHKAGAA